MRRLAVACALSAAAASLWLGCTIWNSARLPEPAETPDGASSSSSSSGDPKGCDRAAIDAAIPSPSLGTGGDVDIVVAVSSITLGATGNKVDPDFGYDLDGVCAPSCVSKGDGGVKDENLGRDDAMAEMLSQLQAQLNQDAAQYANDAFRTGDLGILARIQNYNGQANDDDVLFSLYRSPGTESGGAPSFANPAEKWKIDTTDLKSGAAGDDYTSNTSGHGFVRNGQLIVPGLASQKIPFNGDSDILLQQVSFVADLALDESIGRWKINNAIGVGRWATEDALQTIAHVQDPQNPKKRLCQNPLFLTIGRNLVCASADLNLKDDRGTAACNALSAAVKFETAPAALGVKDTPLREEACAGIPIGGCE